MGHLVIFKNMSFWNTGREGGKINTVATELSCVSFLLSYVRSMRDCPLVFSCTKLFLEIVSNSPANNAATRLGNENGCWGAYAVHVQEWLFVDVVHQIFSFVRDWS